MEQNRYRALALDLDGTLVDSRKELPENNRQAVWKAIDAGVAVILATGRPLFGVLPVARQLELETRGGYVLACNGGNIWDCGANKLIYSRTLPPKCVGEICRIARREKVSALTYFENKIVAENDADPYVQKEAFCNDTKIKKVEDLEAFVNYPVPKLLVVGPHQKLLPVQAALQIKYKTVLDIFFSEDYFLEIVPKNVSKGPMLDWLIKELGLQSEQLIACGDGLNDISMIRYAGLGIAMKNAYPQVKEHAQYIAESNDEDGVAGVIAKFILNSCR